MDPQLVQARAAMIGLGSNLGDSQATLCSAIDAIAQLPNLRLTAVSGFYRSAAIGAATGVFVNAVAQVETTDSPEVLLAQLHQIEAEHGRVPRTRWGDRTLDLDLLWYAGEVRDPALGGLALPHPELRKRDFVLVPLAEIAPAWQLDGKSAAQLLDELPVDEKVVLQRIDPPTSPSR